MKLDNQILLLEKLTGKKVVLESPDWIDANTNKVGAWVGKLPWNKEDAVPFGLKNGQMFIGNKQDIHDNIRGVAYKTIPQEIKNKYSGSPKQREDFDFPGRVWLDSKIISFWQYPKTTGDLNNIVQQLQEEIKTVLEEDIDLVNKGFIEVYLDEDDGIPEFEPYFRPGNVKIIPIKDYDKFLSGKLLASLNEKVLLEEFNKNYSLSIKSVGEEHKVLATLGDKTIGELSFIKSKFSPSLIATSVVVQPNYRRQGIASSMYEFAEEQFKRKFKRTDTVLTSDGESLWNNPNRQFGL